MKIKDRKLPEYLQKSVVGALIFTLTFWFLNIHHAKAMKKAKLSPELAESKEAPKTIPRKHQNWHTLNNGRWGEKFDNALISYIFSFLSPLELLSSSRVCRLWNLLVDDQTLWKKYASDFKLRPLSQGQQLDYKLAVVKHLKEERLHFTPTPKASQPLSGRTDVMYFQIDPSSSETLDPRFEHLYETLEDKRVNSEPKGTCRIDLHGKSSSEAKELVIESIKKIHSLGRDLSIHFISGWGKHVNKKGKRGALSKQLPEWLKDEAVAPLVEKHYRTKGAYEVILTPFQAKKSQTTTCKALKVDVIRKLAESGNAQVQCKLGTMYANGDRVQKDNKQAVYWFRKSAMRGDDLAQLKLGFMCAMGLGTEYNPQKALEWYTKAGNQGQPEGFANIATMYYTGHPGVKGIKGIPQNFEKAAENYMKAASLNSPTAMNMLGILYRLGRGVEKDDTEAVKWDRKAAEAGEPHAKVNLGCMLLLGRGVERNEVEGVKWLREAAEYGLAEAQLWLGGAYERGEGVTQDYVLAREWYEKAASQDSDAYNFDAQFALSQMYKFGRGVEKDINFSNHWLIRSAKNGNPIAQTELGHHYRWGRGFTQNNNQALKYYRLAAEQNHPRAQYCLSEMYELGIGVKKDQKKMDYWMKRAAKNGDDMALLRLGMPRKDILHLIQSGSPYPVCIRDVVFLPFREAPKQEDAQEQYSQGLCYESGDGVEQDLAKAAALYQKAADQGHAEAQNSLGNCYENGKGVKKNLVKATALYKQSATQGNAIAQDKLGMSYYEKEKYNKAFRWFSKSADQGLVSGQYHLGMMYDDGPGKPQGIKKSRPEAERLYQLAAKQGYVQAQYDLGMMYFLDDVHDEEALEWFTLAAEQGDIGASYMVGQMHAKGQGIAQSYEEGLKWCLLAAKQGHDDAKAMLGWTLENDNGLNQPYEENLRKFSIAIAKENVEQQNSLDTIYLCLRYQKGYSHEITMKLMPLEKSYKYRDRTAQNELDRLLGKSTWSCILQ